MIGKTLFKIVFKEFDGGIHVSFIVRLAIFDVCRITCGDEMTFKDY